MIIPGLMLIGMFTNSCKKAADLGYVNSFLTNGTWQLASLQVATYNNDSLKRTDTLNLKCDNTQTFEFEREGACTYKNFHCIKGEIANGSWTITDRDSVIIRSDMVCEDTTRAGSQRPFAYAQVVNLGQNSLVLETVKRDTIRQRPRLIRRTITRYGFLH